MTEPATGTGLDARGRVMLDSGIFPVRAAGARPPLFLVAAPGVDTRGDLALARSLPADQSIYIVQPRRRGRTSPDERIGPGGRDEYPIVAEESLASIRTVQPRGPYQLAGVSDGGPIAFEVARRLEAAGEVVTLLAQLHTGPPENPWRARLRPGRGSAAARIKAPIVVLRVAEPPRRLVRDDALGFRERTTGLVTVHILPGTHESWPRSPLVERYGAVLAAYLAPAPSPVAEAASPPGPPPVSAICLASGSAEGLRRAIESFLLQDHAGKKELIVLADDAVPAIVLDPPAHPSVHVINVPARFHSLDEKRRAAGALCAHEVILAWSEADVSPPDRISQAVAALTPTQALFEGPGGSAWTRASFVETAPRAPLDAEDLRSGPPRIAADVPVSAMCLTYGRPRLLEEAIESFLRQDYRGPKELIVLNDYEGQTLEIDHPEVRVINVPRRFRTLGEKRNAAAALASHDLLFVWDDDDIYLPHRLSFSVRRFDPRKGFFKPVNAWFLDGGALREAHRNTHHPGSCWSRRLFDAVGGYPAEGSGQDRLLEARFAEQFPGSTAACTLPPEELYYIYRFGGTGSYHLSGHGGYKPGQNSGHDEVSAFVRREAARRNLEQGRVVLKPGWRADYPGMIAAQLQARARAGTWRGRLEGALAAGVQRGQEALDALLVRAADEVKR